MAKSLLQGMVGLERLQQRHSPLVFQVSYTASWPILGSYICPWSFARVFIALELTLLTHNIRYSHAGE